MKPTRNIVKPSGMWSSKRRVWFQKNDDSKRTPEQEKDNKEFMEHLNRVIPYDKEESHRRGKERAEEMTKELRRRRQ